ncbi:synapsin-1-like [Pipra filicauda]|uniref:Synapsin-1-like n=1 Tax=Pipra filicauda TaxID=649802 RepID=A0A7R5KGC6_9PASS|nr:synapsin-1-like [Pipra filicauda]
MEVGERACAVPGPAPPCHPGPSGPSPPVGARPGSPVPPRALRAEPAGRCPARLPRATPGPQGRARRSVPGPAPLAAAPGLGPSRRSPCPAQPPVCPRAKGARRTIAPGSPPRSVESQNRQGDTQTKWVMSVSKENTPSKSTKISDESKKESICTMYKNEETLLEKIRLKIGEQMDLNADLFNEKLASLKRRVEQLECTNTYEEISKIFLQKKVAKLERCIDAVVAAQGEVFSEPAVAQNERKEREPQQSPIEEENHNDSEDFEAISTSSSMDSHLAFSPELAEKFESLN